MKSKHSPECLCCTQGPGAVKAKLEESIKTVGHAVVGTTTDIMGFPISMAYTVGLAKKGFPELIVFSLPMEAAKILLNTAASMLLSGKLPVDTPIDNIANMPTVFKAVKPRVAAEFMFKANEWNGGELVNALQMFWPDPHGKFPWDPDIETTFISMQPRLYQVA